jgi:hypothetical protein
VSTSAPAAEASVFDEEAQRRRYDAWLVRWLTEPMVSESPFSALRDELAPLPLVDPWPIDAARGMLANDIRKRPNTVAWELEREERAIDPPPENMDWMAISLSDWEEPTAIRSVLCIPEACYFRSHMVAPKKGRALVQKPGIWIALREHKGKDVLAGILIHKSAPKKPLEHPLLKTWVAELGTRFPLPTR